MILTRRSFITSAATALAMPAIVRVGSLMPVRALVPEPLKHRSGAVLIGTHDMLRQVWVKPDGSVITDMEFMSWGIRPMVADRPYMITVMRA